MVHTRGEFASLMVPKGSNAVSRDVVRNHGREEFATDIAREVVSTQTTTF
jgi:hypothetical protein